MVFQTGRPNRKKKTMQSANKPADATTIRLHDGRTVSYAEYGDPHGKPLLMMHGFPDSRITRNPDDALTASLGVRLIIPDRPGIGLSDFKPARSVVERMADFAELADALGLRRS